MVEARDPLQGRSAERRAPDGADASSDAARAPYASGSPAAAAWSAASAYTAAEALAMDDWLVRERGFTIPQLMQVAGARVAEAARSLIRERALTRVVFLVGPGNNGGDALVAESLLRAELATSLWRPLRGDSAPALDARTLLVDGLFGVGLARPLEGAARAAVEHVNASVATVLAIDIPSGLSATTGEVSGAAIRAHVTVTFVGPKRGFFRGAGPALVGAWRAVDIGFPPEEAHAWLARRRDAESSGSAR